ncbi:MAG: hypothetical protein ACERKD_16590 [Prolixibacteraceae bacterium]
MDKTEKKNDNFHLYLNGFNFAGGCIALAALNSGLKVCLKLDRKLDTTFYPELSYFYPGSLVQTRTAYADFLFLLRCSSLFPHLYFPKRSLFFQQEAKPNMSLHVGFDKLLRRDRESSSLPIRTEKFRDYHSLNPSFELGALVLEYQFDRNQAVRELLQFCVREGLILLDEKEPKMAQLTLSCPALVKEQYSIQLKKTQYPFPNPIRVKSSNFDLILNPVFNDIVVQIYKVNTKISASDFVEEMKLILTRLKIVVLDEIDDQIKKIHSPIVAEKYHSVDEIVDYPLHLQRTHIIGWKREIQKQLGVNINLNFLFDSYPDQAMTNINFRNIQNECDEKFDLAKQTGISYAHFSHLFYRYRRSIDAMIEQVYEKMNMERDAKKLWDEVVQETNQQENDT